MVYVRILFAGITSTRNEANMAKKALHFPQTSPQHSTTSTTVACDDFDWSDSSLVWNNNDDGINNGTQPAADSSCSPQNPSRRRASDSAQDLSSSTTTSHLEGDPRFSSDGTQSRGKLPSAPQICGITSDGTPSIGPPSEQPSRGSETYTSVPVLNRASSSDARLERFFERTNDSLPKKPTRRKSAPSGCRDEVRSQRLGEGALPSKVGGVGYLEANSLPSTSRRQLGRAQSKPTLLSPRDVFMGRPDLTRRLSHPIDNRSVCFDTVQVRQYERTLEVNPSTSSGPSVGLGWRYKDQPPQQLAEEEQRRFKQNKFILSSEARKDILIDLGFSNTEITQAARQNARLREQRKQTLNKLNTIS